MLKPLNLEKLKVNIMKWSGLHDFRDLDKQPYYKIIYKVNKINYPPSEWLFLYNFFTDYLVVILKIQNTLKINKTLLEYARKNKITRLCFVIGM